MPFVFITGGLVLIITAIKGDPAALWELIKGDFTGANNFEYWLIAILVLGFLGYIQSLRSLSRLFMALVLVVLLLDNGGFFAKLQEFIRSQNSSQITAA